MFRGNAGIPEVYGVIMEDNKTLIFQEFAGKHEHCKPHVQALVTLVVLTQLFGGDGFFLACEDLGGRFTRHHFLCAHFFSSSGDHLFDVMQMQDYGM